MLPMAVLVMPARNVRSITISGQNTPVGGLVAVRPSTASFTSPVGALSNSK